MEVLSPYESLDDGDWVSPRISFSQDFQLSGRFSPKMHFKGSPEEEFSFNFHNTVNVDRPTDDSMLSADELFFNGKVRPLQTGAKNLAGDTYTDEGNVGRSIGDNPRCFSMTIESCRGEPRGSRAYMSLHNSRCSSPSRTMSMPRTTPTSPKAKSSLPSSSCSSTSSSTSIMPSSRISSSWMSSSSSSSASSTSAPAPKYSSKFKEFFKLKRNLMSKDAPLPSLPSFSASAEISRECAQSSGSASCRQPSRLFWPFSRSNSAGESKSAPAVSPPPRRSNSAGEGKTTSSSLLPTSIPPSKQPTEHNNKDLSCLASTNLPAMRGLPSLVNANSSSPSAASSKMECPLSNSNVAVKSIPSTAMAKKGLPPLPNSTVKKTSSYFVPAHCGSDSVSLSSQSSSSAPSMQACASGHKITETTTASKSSSSLSATEADPSHVCAYDLPVCTREATMLSDANKLNGDLQHMSDVNPRAHKSRGATSSPGRPVRRGTQGNATRNFARGSPGRRGVWASPGRANGGRVSVRNLERGSISSKGHVRPKDMLTRDGASVRISPVLNVAVPSLRGTKASSKAKIFSLGNLFSKREKVTSHAYTVLPPPDSQSGG